MACCASVGAGLVACAVANSDVAHSINVEIFLFVKHSVWGIKIYLCKGNRIAETKK